MQIARRRAPRATVVAGDAERLPWPDAQFDYVTCLGSLENMLHSDAALAELRRVLKPDGLLCVMMPNKYWLGDVLEVMWKGDEPTSFQSLERQATFAEWRAWLAASGLQVERAARYNKRPVLFAGRKLKSVRKFVWRWCFNTICPFHLSWSFVYVCRNAPPSGIASRYWQLHAADA